MQSNDRRRTVITNEHTKPQITQITQILSYNAVNLTYDSFVFERFFSKV